jgi:molecular chaperone GrpE
MSKKEKKEKTAQTAVPENVQDHESTQQQETPSVAPSSGTQQEQQPQEETLSPQEARILELEAEVERLTKELTAEKEQYMRKAADMDNYRKRLIREKEAAVQFANERLLQDLIPILDDFDRAVEAVSQAPDVQVYAHGIELIRKQLLEMLNRNWGLKRMDDIVGKEFSPHEHEAMMMEESDEYDTETVLAELQKGYYLHDRVLRTAKVKVGKPQ